MMNMMSTTREDGMMEEEKLEFCRMKNIDALDEICVQKGEVQATFEHI